MDHILLGYCGLYCGGCPVLQNTIKKQPMKDENGNEIICEGCNSGKTTGWCTICNIKTCCRGKGFRYCLECDQNPCEQIVVFMNQEQYPYHKEIQENMKRIKELGLEKWIKENEEKYKCSNCNNVVNWFEKTCSKCGNDLKRSYF